jgi:hypothetical protein
MPRRVPTSPATSLICDSESIAAAGVAAVRVARMLSEFIWIYCTSRPPTRRLRSTIRIESRVTG